MFDIVIVTQGIVYRRRERLEEDEEKSEDEEDEEAEDFEGDEETRRLAVG